MFVRKFRGRPGNVFLYLLKRRLPGLICSSRIPVGTEIEFATSCGTDDDIRATRQTWLSVKLQKKEDTLPARQLERSIRGC